MRTVIGRGIDAGKIVYGFGIVARWNAFTKTHPGHGVNTMTLQIVSGGGTRRRAGSMSGKRSISGALDPSCVRGKCVHPHTRLCLV